MSFSGHQRGAGMTPAHFPAAERRASPPSLTAGPFDNSPRLVAQRLTLGRLLGAKPVVQRVEASDISPLVKPTWGDPSEVAKLFGQWYEIGYQQSVKALALEQLPGPWSSFERWFLKNVKDFPYAGGKEAFHEGPGIIRLRPTTEPENQEPESMLGDTTPTLKSERVPVLALYRGLHYGDAEFAGKTDAALESETERQTLLSPAAITMLNKEDMGSAVKKVQADMAGLYRDQATTKWWNEQQGDYEKPIFAVIQRYVQKFRRFQVESIIGNRSLADRYAGFWSSEYGKEDGAVHIQEVLGRFGLPDFNKDQLEVLQAVLKNLHKYASVHSSMSGKPSNLKRLQDALAPRAVMQDPFLSTTAEPLQAAKYALGDKITKSEDRRTRDVVGRLCVYLMSALDFREKYDDALDIEKLSAAEKIEFNSRMGKEKEVTFVGGIHKDDYVGYEDAIGGESAPALAAKGAKLAVDVAPKYNARVVKDADKAAARLSIMSGTKV